jgi:hypothetical protein
MSTRPNYSSPVLSVVPVISPDRRIEYPQHGVV